MQIALLVHSTPVIPNGGAATRTPDDDEESIPPAPTWFCCDLRDAALDEVVLLRSSAAVVYLDGSILILPISLLFLSGTTRTVCTMSNQQVGSSHHLNQPTIMQPL